MSIIFIHNIYFINLFVKILVIPRSLSCVGSGLMKNQLNSILYLYTKAEFDLKADRNLAAAN